MISIESLSSQWIDRVAAVYGYRDKALLEKAIRALLLVESLVREGCPMIFKGGSCLLLLLKDSLHRLSIDVDIICPPGTDIGKYLERIPMYGFTRVVQSGSASSRQNLPISHSKVFFDVEYKTSIGEAYIKLDVLYEDCPYSNVVQIPVEHRFIKSDGAPVLVNVPSVEDMLGDKITAFGPESIGIPYFKKERDCSLEIMKQLFDIGRLFENVSDFSAVYWSFLKVSEIELGYRGMSGQIERYYDDVRGSAMSISTRGRLGNGKFEAFQRGIIRLKPFMYQRSYLIQDAVIDAARSAYLITCFQTGRVKVEKYESSAGLPDELTIGKALPASLSRLKASSPEAFFYWAKTDEIL